MKRQKFPSGSSLSFFVCAACFILTMTLLFHIGRFLAPPLASVEADTSVSPTVIIDPGHGGEDCGAIGKNGLLEKNINLGIALKLENILNACGITTVLTRREDILLYDPNSDYQGQKKVQDLATRRRIAEEYKNAVFVSIHMNAFPQEQYSGLQVYYSPHHPKSQKLARDIQSLTQQTLQPMNNRSIKLAGENIYLLDRLRCTAVLIECGFLSNSEECAKLSTEEYQQELAFVIAMAISQNLSSDSP